MQHSECNIQSTNRYTCINLIWWVHSVLSIASWSIQVQFKMAHHACGTHPCNPFPMTFIFHDIINATVHLLARVNAFLITLFHFRYSANWMVYPTLHIKVLSVSNIGNFIEHGTSKSLWYTTALRKVMPSYQMNYLELVDLIYVMAHFPPNTPRRWDTISEYMTVRRQLTTNAVERIPYLDLDIDTMEHIVQSGNGARLSHQFSHQ